MPVYAFGSNGSGQLGIGHTDDVCTPTRCFFSRPDDNTTTTSSSTGSGTTIDNDPDKVIDEDRDRIRRIAAGGNHTVILYASGAAYAAGMNGDGRCGVGVVNANSWFSSSSSTTKSGNGLEEEGEERRMLVRFARVRLELADGRVVDRFADVSASWAATVFVALCGEEVYVVGSGEKGELGLGETCQIAAEPKVIADFPPAGSRVTAIVSGMSHVVCVLSNGHVYGWGAARKGQLGHEKTTLKTAWVPARIEDVLFRADGAACGREFTVVVSHASGEYIILGSDKWGIVSGAVEPIKGQVSASWHGVYIHNAAENSLVAWGRNDRGQLPPSSLTEKKVAQFAAGSEHAVALLSDLTVVSFGWGEHGNCGAAVDAQGNVKDRVNEIPLSLADYERVVGVAAGCATSWVVTTRS
jgi:protein ATS1